MSQWKALIGRITLFPGPLPSGPLPSALELYKKLWGGEPDNFQTSANALMPTIAQGKRAGMMVGCAVHPVRIDLSLNPGPASSEGGGTSFVLIEDTRQLHAELIRLIEFIDGEVGLYSVCRVGVYLHFLQLSVNIEQANKLLIAVIPDLYRARITDEEDFIFQINRPRASHAVEGVRLNHITKWSMDRFQVLNLAVVADSRSILSPERKEFIAASVTFDSNNVPTSASLNRNEQSSLLRECLIASEQMQREIGVKVEGF
jgi:hypothetical protein